MTMDPTRQGYRVEAVRSGDWWAISVPDLRGVFSQAKRLNRVEATAREAIAMMFDIDESEVGPIDVQVQTPHEIASLLDELHHSVSVAEEASAAVARARREAAKLLRDSGFPMRDIGQLLGISHQRVSQILAQ